MTAAKTWFGVRLVVECQVGRDVPAKRTYEDRLIVVRAASDAEACRRAERLTRAAVERYRNVVGESVTWRFKEVIDSYPILDDELADGTEIYSAFMNYRFYRGLANKGEAGAWPAYVKAHPPRRCLESDGRSGSRLERAKIPEVGQTDIARAPSDSGQGHSPRTHKASGRASHAKLPPTQRLVNASV
jgi:hypothetical protein